MTIRTILLRQNRGLFATSICVVTCVVACISCASISPTSRVLETAESMIGTPYCLYGNTPTCFDCSGFVGFCYAKIGVKLPRRAEDLFKLSGLEVVNSYQPGDLVFFRTTGRGVSHVGIMIDADNFIHASSSRGVMKSPLTDMYWAQRILDVRRLIDDRYKGAQ